MKLPDRTRPPQSRPPAVEQKHRSEAIQPAKQQPLGRLIFGLDLTASREASLYNARKATAAMFETIKSIGSIALKLVYYRGNGECRASRWHDHAGDLTPLMERLGCEAGYTQIARVLQFAAQQSEKISGVIFIGDHCEEKQTDLISLAQALGQMSIPIFLFHECSDGDDKSLMAKPVFKRLAELSGGLYCEFKADSGTVLRELLSSVAAFTTAGEKGIRQVPRANTPEGRRLQDALLLGTSGTSGIKGK